MEEEIVGLSEHFAEQLTGQSDSPLAELIRLGESEEQLSCVVNVVNGIAINKDSKTCNGVAVINNNCVDNVVLQVDNRPFIDVPKLTPQLQLNNKFNHNKQQKASKQALRYRSQSVDYESFGAVFDIEIDVEDSFDSFCYSDDEIDETIAFTSNSDGIDIDSQNTRSVIAQQSAQTIAQQNAQNRHFAYSLPIQVPQWRTSNHLIEFDDDKDVPCIENEEAIAESIKQLAKSVRQETDIFGDRPRRRLNTGDLIKSRPI